MKSSSSPLFLLFISMTLCFSCKNEKNSDSVETIQEKKANSISIITNAMDFQMQDTIPSGWNTFEYKNESNETHFVVFEKYPDGVTIDSTRAQVFPVFDKGMDLINEGKNEEGFAAFNALPAWFFNVEFSGGVGLLSPNETAVSTIKLDPGRYLIECYVKMKNGKFHSVMGMYKEIIVSTNTSTIIEPKTTVQVAISAEKGITFNHDIKTGAHIFKINFIDQKIHENFVGHDVNLVRLSKNADLNELGDWMNWANPKGLIAPAPDHITFIGGMQEMVAGKSGYVHVNLEPGQYALVSEVPNSKSKNMLNVFEVID